MERSGNKRLQAWRQSRLSALLSVALTIAVLVGVAGLVIFQPLTTPAPKPQPPAVPSKPEEPTVVTEQMLIDREQMTRYSLAALGQALPGKPDLTALPARLAESGLAEGAQVFIRIFKKELELELWMKRGKIFQLFATYPICRWSGKLGPKLKEGDYQAPEGFYTVTPQAMNPNSQYHLSFNLGFPNAFDREKGRTGSAIMVHGGCVSIGCFAVTDAQIEEIWRLISAAFNNGQRRLHVHIFPFRMTDAAMAERAGHEHEGFWRSLKAGHDLFERTSRPPRVHVCRGDYRFSPATTVSHEQAEIDASCPRGS